MGKKGFYKKIFSNLTVVLIVFLLLIIPFGCAQENDISQISISNQHPDRSAVSPQDIVRYEYAKLKNIVPLPATLNYLRIAGRDFMPFLTDGESPYMEITNTGTIPGVYYSINFWGLYGNNSFVMTGGITAITIGEDLPGIISPVTNTYDYYWDVLTTTGYDTDSEKVVLRKFITLRKVLVE